MNPDSRSKLIHPEISGSIIGAFYDVYNDLGFGFLEKVYATAMEEVLRAKGRIVAREHPLKVYFRGAVIGSHRCDMVVDGKVIVEIKAGEFLPLVAKRQLMNYLSATRLELGLLLHFGPKPQFHRILGPTGHRSDLDPG